MEDKQTGIAIRFVKQWTLEDDKAPRFDARDAALQIAMGDDRDVPMAVKVADAWAFVKSRIH